MAGSDPKKVRAMGQTPERPGYDAEEDPLIELARIVSEDGAFSTARPHRPKPLREERIDRSAFSADLEAELMSELENSFAPVRRALTAGAPRAPAAQPSPEEPDDPDALLRSIEEQLSRFERRAGGSHAESLNEEAPEAAEPAGNVRVQAEDGAARRRPSAPPDEARDAPARVQPEYRFRGPAGSGRAQEDTWEEDASPAIESPQPAKRRLRFVDDDIGSAPIVHPASLERPSQPGEDIFEEDMRRSQEDLRAAAAEFRRERRPTFSDPIEGPEEDEPRRFDFSAVEAELSRELESNYADPTLATDWTVDEPQLPAEEPAVAPPAAREPVVQAPPRAPAQRGRSRRGLLTAASVIGVIVVGGAAAMYMRAAEQAPSGPPPVISAPEGDVKVMADASQAATEEESVGDAVYARVAGNAPAVEGQVVDNAEEPREIARIILPPSQIESDEPLVRPVGEAGSEDVESAAGGAAAAADGADEDVGPRRVQTFVVRPDGTIVATEPAAVADDPPARETALATEPGDAIEAIPVRTTTIGADAAPNGARNDSGQVPPAAEAEPDVSSSDLASVGADLAPEVVTELPAAPAEQAAALRTEEPAVPQPQAANEAPVDLLSSAPAAAEAAPPPAVASDGGFLVQVSAQRSMEQAQASFADLQRRYGSVLAGLQPTIQEADLGEKGIYYRVRVGPWGSRDEAIGVCESLKAAGGTCFVTQ
ncbi:MAG TPA: SPOR domain-containing protein [Propylenella sp.]